MIGVELLYPLGCLLVGALYLWAISAGVISGGAKTIEGALERL